MPIYFEDLYRRADRRNICGDPVQIFSFKIRAESITHQMISMLQLFSYCTSKFKHRLCDSQLLNQQIHHFINTSKGYEWAGLSCAMLWASKQRRHSSNANCNFIRYSSRPAKMVDGQNHSRLIPRIVAALGINGGRLIIRTLLHERLTVYISVALRYRQSRSKVAKLSWGGRCYN